MWSGGCATWSANRAAREFHCGLKDRTLHITHACGTAAPTVGPSIAGVGQQTLWREASYVTVLWGIEVMTMFPPTLRDAVDARTPEEATHVGVVIRDPYGNVLVSEPSPPAYGVTCTFPRVSVKPDESPADTLDRAIGERAGVRARSLYPLDTRWVTENSSGFYYTCLAEGSQGKPAPTVPGATWLPEYEARNRIEASHNKSSRKRDLSVLQRAVGESSSPAARLLVMHANLVDQGFGRLRLLFEGEARPDTPPEQVRLTLMPASVVSAHHPLQADAHLYQYLRQSASLRDHDILGCWSSLAQPPFGWDDACFDDPSQLAAKYLARHRELCLAGWGRDEGYETWLHHVLELSLPFGHIVPGWHANAPATLIVGRGGATPTRPPPSERS